MRYQGENKFSRVAGAILALALLATHTRAASLIWTNTTGGDYTNQFNWSPSTTVPGTGGTDGTVFTNDTSYTVNFTSSVLVNSNVFNSHAGIVTLDIGSGFAWTLTNSATGANGSATAAFVVGQSQNTTATVYLAGGTLAVTNGGSASLVVGGLGVGQFFVTNGAVIANLTKLGSGPGGSGSGTLVLNGTGASYSNTSTFQIGAAAGSTGNSLVISNSASLTSMSSLSVGTAGSGGNKLLLDGFGRLFTRGQPATIGNGSSNNLATIQGSSGNNTSTWDVGGQQLVIGNLAATGNVLMVNGGIVTNVGSVIVGNSTTSFGNSLIITNGGRFFSGDVTLGNALGANSNSYQIIGSTVSNAGITVGANGGGSFSSVIMSNSTVLNTGSLSLGRNSGSSYNTVTILSNTTLNMAGATAGGIFVGGFIAAVTGNVVTIDGGTITNAGTFNVGLNNSTSNGLVIVNGGRFLATTGLIGSTGGNNNYYNVGGFGAASFVSNAAITVGNTSSGFNTMTVTNATLLSSAATIGNGSSNNTATVLAGGSWNTLGQSFSVGVNGGAFNRLIIGSGGGVTNANGIIGAGGIGAGGHSNSVLVTDGGTWTNTAGLSISGNGYVGNSLTISNGGKVVVNGGNLLLGNVFSTNNTVMVTDIGSIFSVNGDFSIGPGSSATAGSNGVNNVVTVANGATLLTSRIFLGVSAGCVSNSLIVRGPGSVVSNNVFGGTATAFTMGGLNSSFIVSNGATFTTTQNAGSSWNFFGNSNTVLVADGGTLRMSGGSSALGFTFGGTQNSLTVTNGGMIFLNGTPITIVGTNNAVLVTGLGSMLTNSSTLFIGTNSPGNSLTITNGGLVANAGATIGFSLGADSNSVLVTGSGSVWSNTSTLVIGATGSVNRVTVTDGAKLFSTAVTVGNAAGANSNLVTVTGGNSLWQLGANTLTVGAANNTGNVFGVFNGGVLEGNSLVTANAGAGNAITNSGGVYQFTSTAITVTTNGGVGSIAIDSGVISFRGLSGVNLTNNWRGSQLTNLAWSGNNTLRMNNSTATNTLAGGYLFNTGLGPTNYSRLELINGTTGVAGNGLTVGGNGSLLISNTTATISGPVTNYGSATVANSIATFGRGIYNTNSFALDNATVNSAFTNVAGGTLHGNGFIVGNLTNDATISPGFSVGSMSITGNVSLGANSLILIELAGPGSNDMLFVSGAMAYGGTLTVTNSTGFVFADSQSFQLFQFGSHTAGSTFAVTNLPDVTASSLQWNTTALDTTGTISLTLIPEPSELVLVLLGIGGLVILQIKRRRA